MESGISREEENDVFRSLLEKVFNKFHAYDKKNSARATTFSQELLYALFNDTQRYPLVDGKGYQKIHLIVVPTDDAFRMLVREHFARNYTSGEGYPMVLREHLLEEIDVGIYKSISGKEYFYDRDEGTFDNIDILGDFDADFSLGGRSMKVKVLSIDGLLVPGGELFQQRYKKRVFK